jgi:hypothetical protein
MRVSLFGYQVRDECRRNYFRENPYKWQPQRRQREVLPHPLGTELLLDVVDLLQEEVAL